MSARKRNAGGRPPDYLKKYDKQMSPYQRDNGSRFPTKTEARMDWITAFGPDNQPTKDQVRDFVGTPLWDEMDAFLREGYDVQPEMAYSGCSAQPGWNVKFRKGGRSLCTLYPMPGFFIALVVIGSKEHDGVLEVLPECTEYTRSLFASTPHSAGGRWLMMNITEAAILEDAMRLIQVRRAIKKGPASR